MKNIFKIIFVMVIASVGTVILLSSCQYKMISDAPYPEQLIYMPAATYNNYMINTVPAAIGAVPTPGYPTRFTVDTIARKFNVLLAAYRSGIDMNGRFTIDIAVNSDTINKLLAIVGKLPVGTLLLPSDKFSIVKSVEMNDGAELAKFDFLIDLDYLLSNYPARSFAIAVGIFSNARKTNPKYATTIIVIDTKIVKPTANFTASASSTDPKTINFINTSLYGTKYIWNFGDNTPVKLTSNMVNEKVSHTYASAGSYTVTLTTLGISDNADRSVTTRVVVVQ